MQVMLSGSSFIQMWLYPQLLKSPSLNRKWNKEQPRDSRKRFGWCGSNILKRIAWHVIWAGPTSRLHTQILWYLANTVSIFQESKVFEIVGLSSANFQELGEHTQNIRRDVNTMIKRETDLIIRQNSADSQWSWSLIPLNVPLGRW